MDDLVLLEPKLIDMDWKLSLVSHSKNNIEANQFKIVVKLVLDHGGKKGVQEKFLEFSPVQFFEFYKNINECKNLLDMAQ